MPKFEVNTVERVTEKEYVIRLSEEEAKELRRLWGDTPSCWGGVLKEGRYVEYVEYVDDLLNGLWDEFGLDRDWAEGNE